MLGGATALGMNAGCATPTGLPGPGTLNIGLNRSLVSLDNKLNQFDAAVTVQRGVRQALTRLTPDLKLDLVLAERFELTKPNEWTVRLRPDIRYSDNSPVEIADIATALEMYRDTKGGFLATFFPEWPTVVKVDDRTFRMTTEAPLPILDYLMANILITPAAANKPEELQSRRRHRSVRGHCVRPRDWQLPARREPELLGHQAHRRNAFRSGSSRRSPAASCRCAAARST